MDGPGFLYSYCVLTNELIYVYLRQKMSELQDTDRIPRPDAYEFN
jgi:hypothetical protein